MREPLVAKRRGEAIFSYPRFKEKLSDSELEVLYQPNESELDFVRHHARGDSQQFTLLALLKCHQHLGYLPSLKEIPKQVVVYLRNQLKVPQETPIASEVERSRYRYIKQIRSFLQVKSYSHGGQEVAEFVIRKSAYTMSDPADLINVAIEKLIEQRFELPAFSTLDRLATHTDPLARYEKIASPLRFATRCRSSYRYKPGIYCRRCSSKNWG